MSGYDAYRPTHQTDAYEVGVQHGQIIAACVCGLGMIRPDKGLGRADVAAWRTRHADCTGNRTARDEDALTAMCDAAATAKANRAAKGAGENEESKQA